MDKHKLLRVIKYQVLVWALCCYSSHALALEVIEGIGKKTALAQKFKAPCHEIKEVEELPEDEWRNEVGFDYDKAHISDLKTYWDTGTLFYYYVDERGKFGGAINRLKKFGTANQYQIDLNPKINKWVHMNLSFAEASRSQVNFPTRQFRIEAYFHYLEDCDCLCMLKNFEFSVGYGERMFKNFQNQELSFYTASVGYYFDNFVAWFRPTYNKYDKHIFYEVGITRYFSDHYNFIKLSIGSGKYPDVGNVAPFDEVVTARQPAGINLGGQFGMTECLYLRWRVGYTKIDYPTVTRDINDIGLGLLWRF